MRNQVFSDEFPSAISRVIFVCTDSAGRQSDPKVVWQGVLHPGLPACPPGHQDHPLAEGNRHRQGLPPGRLRFTSLTSADARGQDLARLVREHWSIEAHHYIRDVSFGEDSSTSRTGSGPVNLATIRAAIIAAIKDVGYLHIPEGRRDHTTPPKPSASTASIRTDADIHGTRRSPAPMQREEGQFSDYVHSRRPIGSTESCRQVMYRDGSGQCCRM